MESKNIKESNIIVNSILLNELFQKKLSDIKNNDARILLDVAPKDWKNTSDMINIISDIIENNDLITINHKYEIDTNELKSNKSFVDNLFNKFRTINNKI